MRKWSPWDKKKLPKNGLFRVEDFVLLKRRPSCPLDLLAPLTDLLLLPLSQVGYVELKTTSDLPPPKRELLDLSLLLPPPHAGVLFLSSFIISDHV